MHCHSSERPASLALGGGCQHSRTHSRSGVLSRAVLEKLTNSRVGILCHLVTEPLSSLPSLEREHCHSRATQPAAGLQPLCGCKNRNELSMYRVSWASNFDLRFNEHLTSLCTAVSLALLRRREWQNSWAVTSVLWEESQLWIPRPWLYTATQGTSWAQSLQQKKTTGSAPGVSPCPLGGRDWWPLQVPRPLPWRPPWNHPIPWSWLCSQEGHHPPIWIQRRPAVIFHEQRQGNASSPTTSPAISLSISKHCWLAGWQAGSPGRGVGEAVVSELSRKAAEWSSWGWKEGTKGAWSTKSHFSLPVYSSGLWRMWMWTSCRVSLRSILAKLNLRGWESRTGSQTKTVLLKNNINMAVNIIYTGTVTVVITDVTF